MFAEDMYATLTKTFQRGFHKLKCTAASTFVTGALHFDAAVSDGNNHAIEKEFCESMQSFEVDMCKLWDMSSLSQCPPPPLTAPIGLRGLNYLPPPSYVPLGLYGVIARSVSPSVAFIDASIASVGSERITIKIRHGHINTEYQTWINHSATNGNVYSSDEDKEAQEVWPHIHVSATLASAALK